MVLVAAVVVASGRVSVPVPLLHPSEVGPKEDLEEAVRNGLRVAPVPGRHHDSGNPNTQGLPELDPPLTDCSRESADLWCGYGLASPEGMRAEN